ncbi:MAG: hypothetical protein ACLFUJ_04080 [Phycisphaerae bacterium]
MSIARGVALGALAAWIAVFSGGCGPQADNGKTFSRSTWQPSSTRPTLPEGDIAPSLVVSRMTEQVYQQVGDDKYVDVTGPYYQLHYTPTPERGEVSASRIFHLMGRRSRVLKTLEIAGENLQTLPVADLLDTLWVPSAKPDRVFIPAGRSVLAEPAGDVPDDDPFIWMAVLVKVRHARGSYDKWITCQGQSVHLARENRQYKAAKASEQTLAAIRQALSASLSAEISDITINHPSYAPQPFPTLRGLRSEPVYALNTPAGPMIGVVREDRSSFYVPDVGMVQAIQTGFSDVDPDVRIVGRTVIDAIVSDAAILGQ